MTLFEWKTDLLKKINSKDLSMFIVARKEKWQQVQDNLVSVPFKCVFFDPAKAPTYEFIQKMMDLNEKAYGKYMAAPLWTYTNFGTIGSGITGGFMVDNFPISKFNVVGDAVDPDISHEWTLLTDPDYQGKSIGTATLAMAMQVCSHKKYHTFITQTDNPSNLIYLKNSHPMEVLAYGFVHTKTNSMLLKTKIPDHAFEVIINGNKFGESDEKKSLISKSTLINLAYNDHEALTKINDQIQNGQKYYFIDWVKAESDKIKLSFAKL